MDALLRGIYRMNTMKTMKSNRKGRDYEKKTLMIRIISTKIIRNSCNNIFEARMSVKNEKIEAGVEIFNKKCVFFDQFNLYLFIMDLKTVNILITNKILKNLHELYPCLLYVCL